MTGYSRESEERRIAYFITPHGYGHAARASAVMAAIQQRTPEVRFEIFTQVPRWFFQDSLSEPFGYHPLLTDIGLAQKTALAEDIPETLNRLDDLLPFDVSRVQDTTSQIRKLGCQMVLCDIAPMGIAVAREAGIPSVLIENFTWDWIYEAYLDDTPELKRYITYLGEAFDAADYHVQTQPVCHPRHVELTTSPVSRKIRTSRQQVRQQLGIPDRAKMVMITMGGIPWRYRFLEHLVKRDGVYFIIPGADGNPSTAGTGRLAGTGGIVLLPHHSDFFHPDLVNAADAVIGKAGYSTVAEVYNAGVPFGYVGRPRFRETAALTAFIEQEMKGLPITEAKFQSGKWLSSLADLLALPRIRRKDSNGADQVANFIYELLDRKQ
jgi:UDP:flavonoid glycosyltransferase YjiC (YdhE family)